MNTRVICATFAAAIGMTLALASARVLAGKPLPPPPPDPCVEAQARGFPALAFTNKRITGGHVYYDTILADAQGKCQRTVYVADGFAPSFPGSNVNLRHDANAGRGFIVRSGGAPGVTIAMSRYTVTFDPSGVPTVQPEPYSTILALSDIATPPGLEDWSKYVLTNPLISPDGTKMLALVAFRQVVGTAETLMSTFWTCPLNSAAGVPVNALDCQMIFQGTPGGEGASVGWGGGSDSIYITDTSTGGSGRALYRLPLGPIPSTPIEVWNLGTRFIGARGVRDTAGRELVAVYEAAGASGCNKVWVIAANSCSDGGCTPLNGAGSPARSVTWLPDGRLAGEGQTAPNRKGQCSASGSIVVFEAGDPNGTTTTITPAGSQPDGAGGG